jgi:hypothetical protein
MDDEQIKKFIEDLDKLEQLDKLNENDQVDFQEQYKKTNFYDSSDSSDSSDNSENLDNSDNSDDETQYINIDEKFKEGLKKIYQIQINNSKLQIKLVGLASETPDMIIKENFGINSNLNLYNCVYSNEEIDFLFKEIHEDKFIPIIKLIEKKQTDIKKSSENIYTLSVKFSDKIFLDLPIDFFDIYLTYTTGEKYIEYLKLEKEINPSNIIEIFLEKLIELGFCIL